MENKKHLDDPSGVTKTVPGDVVGEDELTILPNSVTLLLYPHHDDRERERERVLL